MEFYGLTTALQIQKILTVGNQDLTVEDIMAQGLEDNLASELDAAVPQWEIVKEDPSKPATQRRLRLFAKYYCAGTVALTAQAFILKKITDGSNEGQRSDKDGWAHLAANLLNKAAQYLAMVVADEGLTQPSVIPSLISRVTPDRDPVTQPRSTSGS